MLRVAHVSEVMDKPGAPRLPDVVYIGRQTHPKTGWKLRRSKWANPYHISTPTKPGDGTRAEVIAKFDAWVQQQPELMAALPELRYKTLACWCKPGEACHGHVLARLLEELDA